MKILFIGGTGNISLSISQELLKRGEDLYLLNRTGYHPETSEAKFLKADINDATEQLQGHEWDVVVNWVAFTAEDIARDIQLFKGKTQQYVFISSASCYQNPGPTPFITERTPLENPYWQYSRDKIEAEGLLLQAYAQDQFPATIVRPSLTYDRVIPLPIGGWLEYNIVQRIKDGRPIVVHGDGTSLWTNTHALDFAKGFIGLLGRTEAIGEDYQITGDEFLSWNEFHQLTAKALGKEANIVHVTSDRICEIDPEYAGTLLGDKTASAMFDNSKIKKLVPEFKATIPFAEGIKRTLNWFEAEPSRQYINPETELLIDRLIATTR